MNDDRRPNPLRRWLPLLWGVALLAGGVAAWNSIAKRASVPEAWRETSGPDGPSTHMEAAFRPGGPQQGNLLRLEWPAHPSASTYHLHFRGADGRAPAPVPVQGTVFLYDLRSDVLHLPAAFEWEVTALLTDGTEIVTPAQRVTLDTGP